MKYKEILGDLDDLGNGFLPPIPRIDINLPYLKVLEPHSPYPKLPVISLPDVRAPIEIPEIGDDFPIPRPDPSSILPPNIRPIQPPPPQIKLFVAPIVTMPDAPKEKGTNWMVIVALIALGLIILPKLKRGI